MTFLKQRGVHAHRSWCQLILGSAVYTPLKFMVQAKVHDRLSVHHCAAGSRPGKGAAFCDPPAPWPCSRVRELAGLRAWPWRVSRGDGQSRLAEALSRCWRCACGQRVWVYTAMPKSPAAREGQLGLGAYVLSSVGLRSTRWAFQGPPAAGAISMGTRGELPLLLRSQLR